MSRSGTGVTIVVAVAVSFLAVMLAFMYVANLLDLPFMSVVDNANTLLFGLLLLAAVLLIEHLSIPLPFKINTTWPIIAAVFWHGVHSLIRLKDENETMRDYLGYRIDLDAPDELLSWYSQDWFFVSVALAIIVLGYFSMRRPSHYR